uniref:p12-14p n=1 Tax=Pyrococcus sp. 12/1 TaxID=758582 RepID=D6MY20_9EURY|nr:p12-14p [Pyrococcus sp. 12/1]ADF80221.1 p12-14p [Pyrococcus sp. 12/1]
MGFRSFIRRVILGDLEDEVRKLEDTLAQISNRLEDLERRVEDQATQLRNLYQVKADKGLYYDLSERVELAREELVKLREEVDNLRSQILALEFSASEKSVSNEMSTEDLARMVEFYIRQGVTRPSELQKKLGISWEKLYAVLDELLAKKRIQRIRKGRKTEYILVEEGD